MPIRHPHDGASKQASCGQHPDAAINQLESLLAQLEQELNAVATKISKASIAAGQLFESSTNRREKWKKF
ncbi:hypothetical protein BH11PSE11_BH11PSE11_18420 [soil metagenome]